MDIISCTCKPSSVAAILRVHNRSCYIATPKHITYCSHYRDLVKLWSALTLLGCYGDRVCVFQVTKVNKILE